MKVAVVAVLSLALLGCDPQQGGDEPRTAVAASESPLASTASPSAPASSVPGTEPAILLPGEYRIAGVGGKAIDLPYAITASITADRIHVTADCLNFAWAYTARGETVATERVAAEGCARSLTAPEQAVVAAIDSASAASRTPANAIELRGGGHSVTLFSQ
jgi:hypothetical protein